MRLARVVERVFGARQSEGLRGHKLLVLEPLDAAMRPGGPCFVAVDALGAGPGEHVLVAHGSRCRDLTLGASVPTKDVVVGIVDPGALE